MTYDIIFLIGVNFHTCLWSPRKRLPICY